MTIRSEKLSDETIGLLPPKKHLFYTNGLMLIIGAMIVLTSWNIAKRPWNTFIQYYPKLDTTALLLIAGVAIIYGLELVKGSINKQYKTNKINELQYLIPLTWVEYKHYIFLAFAAGISEEIIFRGFLITYFQALFSGYSSANILAIIIPSISFSVSHLYQGWSSVLKIFFISILLGSIFVQTGSLAVVIVIHVVIDLVSGMMGIGQLPPNLGSGDHMGEK